MAAAVVPHHSHSSGDQAGASSQGCCCTPETQLGRHLWFVSLALIPDDGLSLMKTMGNLRANKDTLGRAVLTVSTLRVGLHLVLYLRVK